MTFALSAAQTSAQAILASDATHVLLRGGSRSGKTALIVRNIAMRALKAPGSRHAMFRLRFNAIKASIVLDTFPKVMKLAFPGVPYDLNRSDWYAKIGDGSEIWFAGLDDGDRVERVLGMEFVTLFFNECSQIPLPSRDIAMTRLSQLVMQQVEGRPSIPLKPRAWYDCNPPPRSHWTHRLFIDKVDPETKRALDRPNDYASFKINPVDNAANLSAEYLRTLDSLPARLKKRFRDGEFGDSNPNALFSETTIETWRILDGVLPPFVRVVVGVDPSGSGDVDNADNDAIGIIVAALGQDGIAYVIEDCTVKAGPATWGNVATTAFDRHEADIVVGETNYGGDMVRQTIQTARPRTPFKKVTASRGKHVRAEPFSALYETGKVRHVGQFVELEDELCAFSTFGWTGQGSPNRADALIWALAELFPALTKPKDEPEEEEDPFAFDGPRGDEVGWMR